MCIEYIIYQSLSACQCQLKSHDLDFSQYTVLKYLVCVIVVFVS